MNDFEQTFTNIVSEALQSTLAMMRYEWLSVAQNELKSTLESYKAGLREPVMTDPLKGFIELQGTFPNMVETGYTGFDIKDGFANSPKRKKKNGENNDAGWYFTVPFRHYTSSSLGQTMPKDILKEARKLQHKQTLSSALVRRLGYHPQTSHTGYTWKNAQYDSLQRIVKEYDSGKKHGQYITFRRVSDKSDPRSWIHPGYKGLHALDKIENKAGTFFQEYLERSLDL